jgi:FkbM family methyltransferase
MIIAAVKFLPTLSLQPPMSIKLRYLYRAYRYRLRVDPAELRFVCSHLQSGQVAADIGCHKGAYTYWMRRRVGPAGAVYAFEPQPSQIEYLRKAFSAMRYDNVAIAPMAISNTCGSLPLHIPQGAGLTHAASLELISNPSSIERGQGEGALEDSSSIATHPATLDVEVTTVDSFFAAEDRPPNFIKIDVEGHESAVLEGALNTLVRHRPALLIECEARHRPDGDVYRVFDLLKSYGYDGSFFVDGERRPLAEFDPRRHQPMFAGNAPPRGYVNNFAFVHSPQ